MDKIKLTIILTLFAALCTAAYGQVTVGSGNKPVNGALLDIKEKDEATGGVTATKGLLMPRVKLTQEKQLYPMFLADPDNPLSGPNADYAGTKKSDQDKKHIGLVVYNVDDTNGLDLGVHSWDGSKWVAVKSGSGAAGTYNFIDPIIYDSGSGNVYLQAGTADGQVLKWNNTTSKWEAGTDANTTYTAGAGLERTGSEPSYTLGIANDGVTTVKIANANVTPEKIEGGEADYVLTATGTSTAPVWAPLSSSGGNTIIVGPGDDSPVLPAGTVVTLVCNTCSGASLTSTGTFSYVVYSSSGNPAFSAAFSKFNKGDTANDSAWNTNSVSMPSIGEGQYGFVWMLSAGKLTPGNGMYLFGN